MAPGGRVARSIVVVACALAAVALVASPAIADDGGLAWPWSSPPGTLPGPGPSLGHSPNQGPDGGGHRRPPTTSTTRVHRTPPPSTPPAGPPPPPPTPPPSARAVAGHASGPPATAPPTTHTAAASSPPPTATSPVTPPPAPRSSPPSTAKPTTTRGPVVEAALASRAAARRADDVPAAHHPNGLQGQALEALLAFLGLLALGTFLRRFRAPVT